LVTTGENQEHVSRFPFSVGEGSSNMPSGLVFAMAAALGVGAGKKPKDGDGAAA
jgi:hypothetical protein